MMRDTGADVFEAHCVHRNGHGKAHCDSARSPGKGPALAKGE